MHRTIAATRRQYGTRRRVAVVLAGVFALIVNSPAVAGPFSVVEASIEDIHQAIKSGQASCRDVVEAYIDRARAYNGVCTRLITADGKPVPAETGYVCAGAAISFPTSTLAASSFLPKLDQYSGLPLDLGHMAATVSDPTVRQQYGMVAGWPHAGQLNALETINIRGERSVSCKAECDTHSAQGALPAHCPAACEAFRRQPDALERAAELDAQYGHDPDLDMLPMYCATVSVKDWYDVKDMRSTGGNDVDYAMDAAPRDSTVVAALREKGAIIYAVSVAAEMGHGTDGPIKPARAFVGGSGSIRSSWGGHVCNPYDTDRSAGPSSGGAGASVAANLVTVGICETTGGSCREPANQNAVASLVTTKGLISEYSTATAQFANHRPGILARTLADAVRVLDAMKAPARDYFDTRDLFTAIPRALVANTPYVENVVDAQALQAGRQPLRGLRIGIVREYMVKHTANDAAISARVDAEIKAVLRDRLGARIVESIDPQYPDDADVPNMIYTFQDALAEAIALAAPEYLLQGDGDRPEFAVPGYDVRSREYRLALVMGTAPLSDKLNLRRILSGFDDGDLQAFSLDRYLRERGDARIVDWPSYAAHSKWRSNEQAVGARNAALGDAGLSRPGTGLDRIKMRAVFRLAVLKVMRENRIDVFVHPNVGVPQWKIGIDREPTVDGRRAAGPGITDLLGVPEVIVPAGFSDIVYEPHYELSEDHERYVLRTGTRASTLPQPMPFSINFWAGPGDEPVVLKVASAYEAATRHRVPPPDFGPVRSGAATGN